METIKLLELFSGIQSQEKAIAQIGIPYESIGVCDCDKDVLLASAAMRFDLEKEIENYDFPDTETMTKELQDKNIGYSFEKQKHTITSRTPIGKLKQYYISDKLLKNLGDISKVERLPRANFVTYSSPCQSFSVAGKLAGAAKTCTKCGHKWDIDFSNPDYNYKCPVCGNTSLESTTSGLLQEVQRLLSVAYEENELPEYLMLENVKNLVQKKFIGQFNAWVKWLDSIGYNTYYQVLNAKNYGIPQNRERVFAISIRKDIDTNGFAFPEPIPLTTRLKDILEKAVDEKYYLPDERIEKILNSSFMQEKKRIQTTDVCDTLLARDWKDPKCVPVEEDEIKVIGNYMPSNHDASRVVDVDGIAPTVKENHGTVTAIAEPQIIKVDIPQIVKIRTYEVNTNKLSATLKEHKKAIGLTNKDIANQLNKPLTLVEHWFRTDECFSIPDPEIWMNLKVLLKINTDEFDKSIMTFEERPGVFEKSNRCYHQDGISPTITCVEGEKVIVNYEPFIVASCGRNPENPSDRTTGIKTEQRFEPNKEGICNCLTSVQKDSYVVEPQVLRAERTEYGKAIRKQYESGEIDEKIGNMREMKPRTDGVSNTITTLFKDNYIVEPTVDKVAIIEDQLPGSRDARIYKEYSPTLRQNCNGLKVANGEEETEINPKLVGGIGEKNFGKQYRQGNRVYDSDEIAMALNAQPVGNTGGYSYLYAVEEEQPQIHWRVRKLTPLECWRLMNFTDQDCNCAAKYVSASALYKQAGNSIVVACLIAIFSSLFIEDGYKSDVWTKYSLNYDG